MKVIMLKDVRGVGQRDAIIEVSDGYALNALIPTGKAVQATAEKVAELQRRKSAFAAKEGAASVQRKRIIQELDGKKVVVRARANEQGHLFKAVKKEDLITALGSMNGLINASMFSGLDAAIKQTGEYIATINAEGSTAKVHFSIENA